VRLPKTEKFNPSSIIEGKNLILKYCEDYKIQTPSVIIYDGNEYCLTWILKEPLNGWGAVRLWKKVQGFLAEKFFYFLDKWLYIYDGKLYRETACGQMGIKIFVVVKVVAKKKFPPNVIITNKRKEEYF